VKESFSCSNEGKCDFKKIILIFHRRDAEAAEDRGERVLLYSALLCALCGSALEIYNKQTQDYFLQLVLEVVTDE
jgi:hypothetical protein